MSLVDAKDVVPVPDPKTPSKAAGSKKKNRTTAIAVIGGGGAFLAYKLYKSKQAASATTPTSATVGGAGQPAAAVPSTVPPFGSGGGSTGSGIPPWNRHRPTTPPTPTSPPTPGGTTVAPTTSTVVAPVTPSTPAAQSALASITAQQPAYGGYITQQLASNPGAAQSLVGAQGQPLTLTTDATPDEIAAALATEQAQGDIGSAPGQGPMLATGPSGGTATTSSNTVYKMGLNQ